MLIDDDAKERTKLYRIPIEKSFGKLLERYDFSLPGALPFPPLLSILFLTFLQGVMQNIIQPNERALKKCFGFIT